MKLKTVAATFVLLPLMSLGCGPKSGKYCDTTNDRACWSLDFDGMTANHGMGAAVDLSLKQNGKQFQIVDLDGEATIDIDIVDSTNLNLKNVHAQTWKKFRRVSE